MPESSELLTIAYGALLCAPLVHGLVSWLMDATTPEEEQRAAFRAYSWPTTPGKR